MEIHKRSLPKSFWNPPPFFCACLRYLEPISDEIPGAKTVSYWLESIRYLCPKIWKLIPDKLKESKSLELFKEKVKGLKTALANYVEIMFTVSDTSIEIS